MNKDEIEREIAEKGDNCWDNIGVFGNITCELLEAYEHCHNCPIYLFAGRRLFKKEADEALIEDWTKIYSLEKETDLQNKRSVVLFRIQNEWFAIDTGLFQEAVVNKMIHIIPGRSNKYLYGIVNVNGELYLTIAMESLVGLDRKFDMELNSKQLLVLNIDNQKYCFPIDEFDSVKNIKLSDLEEIPQTISKIENNIIDNVFKTTHKSKINNESHTIEIVASIINNQKLISSLNRNLVW